MYRTRSRNLRFRLRLVCPTYDLWQVLHVILYIPLFSCCEVWIWVVGIKSSCDVVVALNFIPMLVFLNKFVILLIFGLCYVNVVQILRFFSLCMWLTFLCIWWLSFWSRRPGKLLFVAVYCIFSILFVSWGRECIRVIWNLNTAIFFMGWFERKLIVVSVQVGFLYMSTTSCLFYVLLSGLESQWIYVVHM